MKRVMTSDMIISDYDYARNSLIKPISQYN